MDNVEITITDAKYMALNEKKILKFFINVNSFFLVLNLYLISELTMSSLESILLAVVERKL